MKIASADLGFRPVVITLESLQEVQYMQTILNSFDVEDGQEELADFATTLDDALSEYVSSDNDNDLSFVVMHR